MTAAFRFVHAADLHLGSTPAALASDDPAAARQFADAVRGAFAELIRRTREAEAAFAVIAGDIYDGEWRDAAAGLFFNRELARLGPGFPVFLCRGNHDAASVVTTAVPLPPGVRVFGEARPETFRLEPLRVALHGQSFARREETRNLAAAYPAAVPGWFNIGVLHSALEGRAGHEPYAPCTLDDLRGRGYDYWALGHAHAFEVVAERPHVVFPGVLQGRHVRETGPKGAVLVTVEDGRVTALERLIVDRLRWAAARTDLSGVEDRREAEARIRATLEAVAAGAEGRPCAVRLTLAGRTGLAGAIAGRRGAWLADVQALAHQADTDLWVERLDLALAAPEGPVSAGLPEAELDPAALLAAAAADPQSRAEAEEALRLVAARLPAEAGAALGADIDALLAEARAVALARLLPGGGG